MERLDAQKQVLINKVWATPDSQRVLHPKDASFSPVELLMHIALIECKYNDALDETPPEVWAGRKAKPSFLYNFILNKQREGGPNVPAPKEFMPKWVPGVDEAIAEWDKQRERLKKHLERAKPGETFVAMKWLGKMSADHVLELLDVHQNYHIRNFRVAPAVEPLNNEGNP